MEDPIRQLTEMLPEDSTKGVKERALEFIRAELDAFPDKEVVPVNFDIVTAAPIVMAAHILVQKLREQILLHAPTVDIGIFDRLGLYLWAAQAVDIQQRVAVDPIGPLKPIRDRLLHQRETWRLQLMVMARQGIIPVEVVKKVSSSRSTFRVAQDVEAMSVLLRTHFKRIENHTFVTMEQIDEWARLAQQAALTVTVRKRFKNVDEKLATLRKRVFSLLAARYDEVRRVVSFLRWKKRDADKWAPALHTAKRKTAAPEREPEKALVAAPVASSTVDAHEVDSTEGTTRGRPLLLSSSASPASEGATDAVWDETKKRGRRRSKKKRR